MKRRLLDLFCGAGGAGMGYHRAGFEVIGVDMAPQPHYPFEFMQGDALMVFEMPAWIDTFDAIHASPPCQGYTTMANKHGSTSPRLIHAVRQLLIDSGLPYIIENVTGARGEMVNPMAIHGGQVGLRVYRPRLFESNIDLTPPPYAKRPANPVAIYGHKYARRLLWTRKDGTELRGASEDEAREAMDMPWATWDGCREAIPPAYAEFVGRQLMLHLDQREGRT